MYTETHSQSRGVYRAPLPAVAVAVLVVGSVDIERHRIR